MNNITKTLQCEIYKALKAFDNVYSDVPQHVKFPYILISDVIVKDDSPIDAYRKKVVQLVEVYEKEKRNADVWLVEYALSQHNWPANIVYTGVDVVKSLAKIDRHHVVRTLMEFGFVVF